MSVLVFYLLFFVMYDEQNQILIKVDDLVADHQLKSHRNQLDNSCVSGHSIGLK